MTVLNDLGKKCSFVSAAVKQSGWNWELQKPSTIAALSSLRTVTLFSETETGCSEGDRMYEAFSQSSVSR